MTITILMTILCQNTPNQNQHHHEQQVTPRHLLGSLAMLAGFFSELFARACRGRGLARECNPTSSLSIWGLNSRCSAPNWRGASEWLTSQLAALRSLHRTRSSLELADASCWHVHIDIDCNWLPNPLLPLQARCSTGGATEVPPQFAHLTIAANLHSEMTHRNFHDVALLVYRLRRFLLLSLKTPQNTSKQALLSMHSFLTDHEKSVAPRTVLACSNVGHRDGSSYLSPCKLFSCAEPLCSALLRCSVGNLLPRTF